VVGSGKRGEFTIEGGKVNGNISRCAEKIAQKQGNQILFIT